MSKIGIISGSFDPITNGHVHLIKRALDVLGPDGTLRIVIACNPTKSGYFSPNRRSIQIKEVLSDVLTTEQFAQLRIGVVSGRYTAQYAKNIGATIMFRGIRNAADLAYEADIQTINAGINPDMETVFFIPSREYMHISSSVVRGLVGFADWETVLVDYVHPFIIKEFKEREET